MGLRKLLTLTIAFFSGTKCKIISSAVKKLMHKTLPTDLEDCAFTADGEDFCIIFFQILFHF